VTDSSEEPVEVQAEPELYTSPLREMAVELHEIYTEFEAVGFPEKMLAHIIAHMASDALLYRSDYEDIDEEDGFTIEIEDDDTDEREP
jgi:hypothetical protein